MTDDKPTGLYDPYVTPSGTFRKWHETGTIECMVNGVWQSIPEPAQAEIKRLEEIAIAAAIRARGTTQ